VQQAHQTEPLWMSIGGVVRGPWRQPATQPQAQFYEHGQTAKRTVDGRRHPTTHTKVAEERAAHGTKALDTCKATPSQYDRCAGEGCHLGTKSRIICHLPDSHAVRETARTRPRIHHISRLAGSDEEVSDRPPRPRTRNRAGHYPVE